MFNPDEFLNAVVNGANSTQAKPIPEHETDAAVKDVKIKTTPKGSVIMEVIWIAMSQAARDATNLPEPTVRQSLFLDITDQGQLDMAEGKNIALGRLRKALGQNTGTWSPSMMVGKTAKIFISQRADEKDPTRIYNDVKSVAAA